MEKISILHVLDSPYEGGAQEAVLQLAKNIDRKQFSVHVLFLHGHGFFSDKLLEIGIPVYSLANNKLNPFIFFKLIMFFFKNRYHIVHTNLFFSCVLGTFALRLSLKKHKLVFWIHAHSAQLPFYNFPVYFLLSFFCDLIIAQVPSSVKELKEGGIPSQKIKLVEFGFNPDNIHRSGSNIRREYNIPENVFVISRVARFHPDKGILELIDIMDLVWEKAPEIYLLLVGGGPLENKISKRIKMCSRPHQVITTGIRYDLYEITLASDIVACSSITEGLGLTNLAAIFLGIPIISFDVGAISLAVENGRNGYLIRK